MCPPLVRASLLITHRLTPDSDTGRPLLLEELRASADSAALTFRITAPGPECHQVTGRDRVRVQWYDLTTYQAKRRVTGRRDVLGE